MSGADKDRVESVLPPWAVVQPAQKAPAEPKGAPDRSRRAWYWRRPIPVHIISAYCTLQWVCITFYMIGQWALFRELMRTGALAPISFAAGFVYPLVLFMGGVLLFFMRKMAVSFFVVYLLLGLQKVLTQNVSFPGRFDLALVSGILVYCLRLRHIRWLK